MTKRTPAAPAAPATPTQAPVPRQGGSFISHPDGSLERAEAPKPEEA